MLKLGARPKIVIAAMALFWLLSAGWLTALLLAWTQAGTKPVAHATFSGSTAIIMLGGGTDYDTNDQLIPRRDPIARIAKTAEL
ncbi:MAG TPA: YdcF family protein, partial [Paraburkholderia sp.]|nr:YdcF family protein [Paraburkholderia sp.]